MPPNRGQIIVDARDQASMKLYGIQEALQGLSGETVRFGKVAASAAPATAGIGQAANMAAKSTQDFQSRLRALTGAGMLSTQQAARFQAAVAILNRELQTGQINQEGYRKAVSEVGRAMEQSADKGQLFTRLGLQEPQQEGSRLQNILGGVTGKIIAMGAAYVGVKGLRMAHDMALLGAQTEMTEQSFKRMVASVGASADILDKMKQAAGGTIPELQLMQALNTSLIGTSAEFGQRMAEAYPQLVEIARAASMANPALGDTGFMIRSLSIGLKRMSPLIIDNLGLQVKVGDANKKYAEQLGKTTKEMTTEEKQMALLNETLRAGRILVDQVGVSSGSAAVKHQTLGAAFADTKVEIGKGLGFLLGYQGILTKVVRGIGDFAGRMNRANSMTEDFNATLKDLKGEGKVNQAQFARLRFEADMLKGAFLAGKISTNEYRQGLIDLVGGFDTAAAGTLFLAERIQQLGRTTKEEAAIMEDMSRMGDVIDTAFIKAESASARFEHRLQQLIENEQLSVVQANMLAAEKQKLFDQFDRGTISSGKLAVEVAVLLELLPDVEGVGIRAAKGILALEVATPGAIRGLRNLRGPLQMVGEAADRSGQIYYESTMAMRKSTKEMEEDIINRAQNIATSYGAIVPVDIVAANLEQIANWARANAEELIRLDEWERDVRIQLAIETAFGTSEAYKVGLDEQDKALKKFMADQDTAYKSMVSRIEGLIKPTMPESWWKDMLPREDAWDEWARRSAAVANEGFANEWFAQLQAKFPSFQKALEEAGGNAKLAGAIWAKMFYAGQVEQAAYLTGPLVSQYTELLEQEALRANLAQIVAQQIGGVDIEPAAVGALLGGDQATAQAIISGQEIGQTLTDSLGETLTQPAYALQLVTALETQFQEQQDQFRSLGVTAGEAMQEGVLSALTSATFVSDLAQRLAPEIFRQIQEWGWGRCAIQQGYQ